MIDMSAQLERLTGSTLAGARTWSAPQINGRALSPARMNSPDELQGAEKQAWIEAEAAGRAAGLAAAQRQIDQRVRQLEEATAATGRFDIVDVFRRPEHTPDIARSAVATGAGALWLQLGVVNWEAAQIAHDAGLPVVMDRCTAIEYRRIGR